MKKLSYLNRLMPAFTVLELIIVMILSGIVIGLTYLYFTQFQHYIRQASLGSEAYIGLDQFSTVFQKDMDDAGEIYYRVPSTIRLLKDEEEIDYSFEGNVIIRKLEYSNDTFHIKSANLDVLEMEDYNDLVEYIGFDIQIENDAMQQASFIKDYNSKTLFNFYDRD